MSRKKAGGSKKGAQPRDDLSGREVYLLELLTSFSLLFSLPLFICHYNYLYKLPNTNNVVQTMKYFHLIDFCTKEIMKILMIFE